MEEVHQPLAPQCDHETFARVWNRVMPTPTPACPIQLIEKEPAPIAPPPLPLPSRPHPAPHMETQRVHTHDPFIQKDCNGSQLQALIHHALMDSYRYQQMARRQKNGSKTLMVLSTQRKKHAKKLSAAYFLLSGVRYWPNEPAPSTLRTPYPAALRQLFYGAQHSEEAYHMAALESTDQTLKELHLTLAQEMAHHATLLRHLIEQSL